MTCPLCTSKKIFTVNKTSLSELKENWLSTFGFDPFPIDFTFEHIVKMSCSVCRLEYYDPPYYGDAGFYAKVSTYPCYYEQNKWEFDVAAEIISQLGQSNLLEIGCGNGYFLEKVSQLGCEVEGVDINRDAVNYCKAKGLKVDATDVFEISKSYDTVVLFQVLEHMDSANDLFKFLTSKLIRSGGHLVIAVPNPDGYLKEIDLNLLDMPPHHNSSWRLATFEHLSSQFGLELVAYHKEPIRYAHYLIFLRNIINEQVKFLPRTYKVKLMRKLQLLVVGLLAPMSFLRDRNLIDGQTHLAVLKNCR